MNKTFENIGEFPVGNEEKKSYKIKKVCMYCKESYGECDGGQTEGQVSHGICPKEECVEKFKKDWQQ